MALSGVAATAHHLGVPRDATVSAQLLRSTLDSASYVLMPSHLDSNGYTGLHCTARPDQQGASLGLSGDGFAEAAAGMAAIIARRGPMGPALAIQLALRVILASWFPIQIELMYTPGRPHGARGVRKIVYRAPPRGDS